MRSNNIIIGGRFEVEWLAGCGGMGKVFCARDRSSGERVAVKLLLHEGAREVARFEREARVLAALSHPAIVRYVAHGTAESGAPYLAMEWLDGESLQSRLLRTGLTLEESLQLVIRVANALGAAHACGIVHRDLKPSNIFIVKGNIESAKLLDFGIAHLSDATRMTRTGMLIGTPGYMAPEQASGAREVDARADVFSLGCILFECLTGEPVFHGAHVMAILAKVLLEEPPGVREKRPALSEALDSLTRRMLAKRPQDRPPEGYAVAEALQALEELRGLVATKPAGNVSRPHALTGSERRAMAIIFLGAMQVSTTIPAGAETLDGADALRREAVRFGGRFARMIDGSAVVMLTSTSVATDLAAEAGRCALALHGHASGRSIAIAMGCGDTTGRLPTGPAIDRAAKIFSRTTTPAWHRSGESILLDDLTARLLDARFDVRESEVGIVLHGERRLAEGTRTLLGKATPCVGRDRELRMLEEFLDECFGETINRAVLVTAPAGAGKSRLAQEFLRHVAQRDERMAIWIARGDSLRAGSPFSLLGQAVRAACEIHDGEPIEVRREKLVTHLHRRIAEAERKRVAEFLGEVTGTPFPDDESLPLRMARKDAQLMNDQTRAAFLDFIAAECHAAPVCIVLEDLHWGDRPTVQFFDRALRRAYRNPMWIFALARPEVHDRFPNLWGEPGIQEIRLGKLSPKAIERLSHHVLGENTGPETIARLVRLSEGNAFYLEELIRALAEGRAADLPETVVAMVQSRLAALDDASRRVLRAASVFGEVFWPDGVTLLLNDTAHTTLVKDRLTELIDRELLVRRSSSRFAGQEELAFRHALLREGAYAMLTDEDRALGHRLAGEWLEQRGEQDMLVLAEHFERGGEGTRAGQCYLRAAELANQGGDAATAIALARRGLARPVPEALRIRLLGMLCEPAFWHLDSLSAVLPDAQELVLLAERGSLPWLQGMFAKLNGSVQAGRFAEFMQTLGILRQIDASPGAADPLALSLAAGAYLLDVAGLIDEANALHERLTAIAGATADHEPLVAIIWHGVSAMRNPRARKDPWNALGHGDTMVTLARATGHTRYIGVAQLFIGMNLWFFGASAEAERTLKQVALPDEELSYASHVRPFCLAWLLADRGAFDEARMWACRLVISGKTRRMPLEEAQGHWALAQVLCRAGDLEGSETEMHAALAVIRELSPLDLPGALATLAALRLAQRRPAEAVAAAQEGMTRDESMGVCSFFFRGAFLYAVHAESLQATGHDASARAAIAKARQFVITIAGKIGNAAYQKSFLENVPENRKILDLAHEWLEEAA